jgi:hypothetical protein
MVLSIIFLEDKHRIVLHLSIFYEFQQFFQHRICFSIQPQLQLVNLHRNQRYFVIKLHTWFCLSVFSTPYLFLDTAAWLQWPVAQRQSELLPSLGIRRLLTFHILIFSSETPQPNELKLGRKHLCKVFYKIANFVPIH